MKIKIQVPTIFDVAFILYFTYSIWVAALKLIIPDEIIDILAPCFMIAVFGLAIYAAYQCQHIGDVFWVYLIVVVLFALTYLFNTGVDYCYWVDNWGVGRMLQFSTGGIWAYLAIRLIPNHDKLLSNFKVVAYIFFVYYLYTLVRMLIVGAWYIVDNQGVYQYSQYNMGFGYSMIFVAIVFLCLWSIRRKISDLVIMLVAAVTAFIWGSRGSILCLGMAAILLILLTFRNISFRRRAAILIAIIVVAIMLFLFATPILTVLSNLLESIGIQSRTLQSVVQGSFTTDSARSNIWSMVSNEITSIFPFGLGTFGDRTIVMPYYSWGYSHNIFLEMTISFGILGIAFLVWLIYRIMKVFQTNRNSCLNLIILTSMCVKLFFSDSFWFFWAFWGLLAICISTRTKRNKTMLVKQGTINEYAGESQFK